MVVWAFRYCLGRKTYAVEDCVSNIVANWDLLNIRIKNLIHKEINEAIAENRIGMEMDYNSWQKVLACKTGEGEDGH